MSTTAAPPAKATPKKVTTPEFRVSFPHVFVPADADPGKQPRYEMTMLFPKSADLSGLKVAALAAAIETWGADKTKWPKFKNSIFRDGNEKDMEGYKDTIYVKAKSKDKPGLVDQAVEPILNQAQFYAGCYARATIVAFTYNRDDGKGVAFALNNIQKLREGQPFGSRRAAEDDFDAVAGGAPAGAAADDFGSSPAPTGAAAATTVDPLTAVGAASAPEF